MEVSNWSWPFSGSAVGLGLWVFFAWCWLSVTGERRIEAIICFGLVSVGGVTGGLMASLAVGEVGLSSLGAILGGGAMLMATTQPWRREKRWLLDHIVPGGLAGLAVARLGCLLEGCDFGRPVESGISIVYESGTRAWETHVLHYGVSPFDELSLAVHPFAAYLAICGFAAAVIGERLRRRGGAPGIAAMVSITFFLAVGGMVEWFREPLTVVQIAEGISAYPFIYLGGAFITSSILWAWLRRDSDRRVRKGEGQ